MSSEFILSLADSNATLENAGGKGTSLTRLSRAGLPVPGGFHITTEAYRNFVSVNRLQERILAALNAADASRIETLETASAAIQELFLKAAMPQEIQDAITAAYSHLSAVPATVAVRSSATAEDLPDLSFAGQQETYLNIHGIPDVLDAVKRCWASLWTARAIGYRAQHSIASDFISLAVVVQVLVQAEAAGVMFTANPASGRRDQVMITAAWGLGEAIVGGLVTPDTLVVDKASGKLLKRETAHKEVMTVLLETGTQEQPLAEAKRESQVLSDGQAAELARLGVQIETLYSLPMDIEWALADGKFAILQARPITALPAAQVEPPTEWKMPDPKATYMRASIIEQLPEPLSPLFSTLGGPIIDDATLRLFSWMGGIKELKQVPKMFVTINDYGYMNLKWGWWNTLRITVGMMLKMNWIFKTSEPRWQQARNHTLDVIRRWQAKPLRATAGEYSAAELLNGIRELTGEAVQMYTVLQTGPVAVALGSETLFTQVYNRLIKKKGDPDASVFVMGYESMPIRADQALYDLAEWARTREGLAAHLVAAPAARLAAELESGNTPAGLNPDEWNEWQRRFREHLAKYGHFIYDMDFSKAVAADDPAPLLETCRMILQGKVGSPYARVKAIAARREQAVRDMLKRLHGPALWLFRSQLKSAQKNAPLREDGLSDLGLSYPLLRQMARELGRRLVLAGVVEQPDDVFWLHESELDQATGALDLGQPMSSMNEAVHNRRRVWSAEQRVTPPITLPLGSKYMGMDVEKMMSGGASVEENVIKGFGTSQGKVTAPARVLFGPQDFAQMQPGDVLVAPATTPAWTPLFALASAIVTDIGGPLSHGSIVAREYGIPAVLGTGIATRRLRSGQMVTVDGGAGTVSVINQG